MLRRFVFDDVGSPALMPDACLLCGGDVTLPGAATGGGLLR